jgi:CrcB protein
VSAALPQTLNKSIQPLTLGLILAIAFGAALGALARESLALLANGPQAHSFPWGTLGTNLGGAFLLGLFATYVDRLIQHDLFGPFWEIGFIRSFTTLSTFSLESVRMVEARAWETLFPYIVLSVLGGLLLIFLGDRFGQFISNRRGLPPRSHVRDRVETEL